MTVSHGQNFIPYLNSDAYDDTTEGTTRLQIVEGEMYDFDNRLVYIEDQMQELHELLNHIHAIICSDAAGNEHSTQVDVTPLLIDMSLNQP